MSRRAGRVEIADRQGRVPVPAVRVRRLARGIAGGRNLSIAFVTNAEIRRLNRRHLGHDYATDVLAFPIGGDPWGEVVVSAEYARAEARRRGIPAEEELLRCVAHGILHLLGYDDRRPADRARMWERQERELRKVASKRPPC